MPQCDQKHQSLITNSSSFVVPDELKINLGAQNRFLGSFYTFGILIGPEQTLTPSEKIIAEYQAETDFSFIKCQM